MRILSFFLFFLFLHLLSQAQDAADSSLIKGKNLIANGSFDEGNSHFTSALQYVQGEVSPGNLSVTRDASIVNPSFAELSGHTTGEDPYLVADPAGAEGEKLWCANVYVTPATPYEFSVWMAFVHRQGDNPPEIALSINGKKTGSRAMISSHEWVHYTWRWHADTGGVVAVCLLSEVPEANGNDIAIDDIAFYSLIRKPVVRRPPAGDTLPQKVHFPFNETVITEYSRARLESLLKVLETYPEMHIKILAHTDMYGEHGYNNRLSEQRAKAVYDYLVSRNIDPARLSMEAFGEQKLLYHGRSSKENVRNRRVEFVIEGYGKGE